MYISFFFFFYHHVVVGVIATDTCTVVVVGTVTMTRGLATDCPTTWFAGNSCDWMIGNIFNWAVGGTSWDTGVRDMTGCIDDIWVEDVVVDVLTEGEDNIEVFKICVRVIDWPNNGFTASGPPDTIWEPAGAIICLTADITGTVWDTIGWAVGVRTRAVNAEETSTLAEEEEEEVEDKAAVTDTPVDTETGDVSTTIFLWGVMAILVGLFTGMVSVVSLMPVDWSPGFTEVVGNGITERMEFWGFKWVAVRKVLDAWTVVTEK